MADQDDSTPDAAGEASDEPEASEDASGSDRDEPPKKPRRSAREVARACGGFLVRVYASVDPRSLGLFRIVLGTLLVYEVVRRLPYYEAFYTNDGWLTNHYALYRPMSGHLFSVYHAFGTRTEVGMLLAFHLVVNVMLLIGWHTRIMNVLAAVLITSLNSRNIMVENGGYVVTNLLTIWAMFLPLGTRFSVDAVRRAWKRKSERTCQALDDPAVYARDAAPIASLAVLAIILQWVVIYFFNTVQKNGPSWANGTALYYFLQQDRIVTPFGAWIREVMPLGWVRALTWGTLVVEGSIPALLLTPVATSFARKVAFVGVLGLHLSIGLMATLGPFAWVMMTPFFVAIDRNDWERLGAWLKGRCHPRTLWYDDTDGFSLDVCHFVKLHDAFGLVRYAPLPEERRDETLTVTEGEELDGRRYTGSAAVVALQAALPYPKWAVLWMRLPGLRGLVDRLLARMARSRSRLTVSLGLDGEREPLGVVGPSRARRALEFMGTQLGQVGVLLLFVATGSQVLIENRFVPEWMKPHRRPEWMTAVVVYPRLFQGWSMFAPDPPKDDGRVVVDGLTVDGRSFDPLTGAEPSFDVQPPGGYRMDALWQAFHTRIHEARFRGYLSGFKEYLLKTHVISGRPNDRIVAMDVWYVSEVIPPPGAPRGEPNRRKLFSHGRRHPAQGAAPKPVRQMSTRKLTPRP